MGDSPKDYKEMRDKIIAAFDKALEAGDWESTLFFKALGKRLRELREFVVKELSESPVAIESTKDILAKEGYIPVYISIYQADGGNLEKWRNTIRVVAEHIISRPVYREEEHVRALIRSKAEQRREGYVIALVKENDILPPYAGKPQLDRFNHEMINLKEGSVKLANIIEFVHEDKRHLLREGEFIY